MRKKNVDVNMLRDISTLYLVMLLYSIILNVWSVTKFYQDVLSSQIMLFWKKN